MLKHEFEKRLGREITLREWDQIENIYMLYPAINGNDEKQAYVLMFKTFGMRIFNDMGTRVREIEATMRDKKVVEDRLRFLGVE